MMKEQLQSIIAQVRQEYGYKYIPDARCALEQVESKLLKFSPWTSIDDALPEIGQEVLIMTNGQEKEMVVGRLTVNGWYMELGYNYGVFDEGKTMFEVVNVTHWMPLPKPPVCQP